MSTMLRKWPAIPAVVKSKGCSSAGARCAEGKIDGSQIEASEAQQGRPISPVLGWTVIMGCLLLMGVRAIKFILSSEVLPHSLIDFDSFYIVSQMIFDGKSHLAYTFERMLQAQEEYSKAKSFLPWTYPPPYNVIVAPLSLLPISLAYLAFMGSTFAFYIFVLRRLSGELFTPILLAVCPALFINITCGQNGFLTSGLVGVACLLILRRRTAAGLPLGLLVIKPHIAIGLAIHTLLVNRKAALAAIAVAASVCLLTAAAFGPEIWLAFVNATKEAKQFLEQGYYPLFRMTSFYATLLSIHVPASWAITLQVALGCAVTSFVCLSSILRYRRRVALGMAVLASLLMSPYGYDYDLPLLGIAAGVVARDLFAVSAPKQKLMMLALTWTASSWGFLTAAIMRPPPGVQIGVVSGASIALILLMLSAMFVLARGGRVIDAR